MKNEPLVSVIIPAYNCEKYIGKAVESVLEQDVPLEVLIIDDCSADGTEKEIKRYLDIPYLHYYKNEKNLGAAASRNKGVKYAVGKYVAFLRRLVGAREAEKAAEKNAGGKSSHLQYRQGAG